MVSRGFPPSKSERSKTTIPPSPPPTASFPPIPLRSETLPLPCLPRHCIFLEIRLHGLDKLSCHSGVSHPDCRASLLSLLLLFSFFHLLLSQGKTDVFYSG